MNRISQCFTISPVGQGLFYSGNIQLKDGNNVLAEFKLVYDCGSLNTANADEEVARYRASHFSDTDKRLELLIISHFDMDHVSHIKQLLDGGRKVDNVVLPFTLIEERLFLALKSIDMSDDNGSLGGIPFDFIIDPVGSLEDNLDGRSRIFIINSDPDNPPFDLTDNGNESGNFSGSDENAQFGIDGAESADLATVNFSIPRIVNGQIFSTKDSSKGFISIRTRYTKLMEFLFYRRDIGSGQENFFKEIFNRFCRKYDLGDKPTVDQIIDVLRGINSAEEIRPLFRDTVANHPTLSGEGRSIANMNTTALCMLHYNLPGIYSFGNGVRHGIRDRIVNVSKFNGLGTYHEHEGFHDFWGHNYLHYDHGLYPNCLLTSDTFIQTDAEVNDFYKRYQNYWTSFWMFQIPHHGSRHNASIPLLARLNRPLTKFMNYGTTHRFISRWRHPSPELISDLVVTGHSHNVVSANEFSGIKFEHYILNRS